MKGTFEWELTDGRTCRLEADYECAMEPIFLGSGEWAIKLGEEPRENYKNKLVAYVDGEEFDRSIYSDFWGLVDTADGHKKISGLNIAFAKADDADRYAAWIAGIIDSGKSDEVKAYEKAEREKEIKEKVEEAKAIIKSAEKQKDIPTRDEARKRMKQYNDFMNEGGEGFVLHIYSAEEYEYAKQIVARYASK